MAYQQKKSPAFNTASRTIVSSGRGRPIGKLRTIDEAAEVLNTSSRTVRRLIESGALQVHRIGIIWFAFQTPRFRHFSTKPAAIEPCHFRSHTVLICHLFLGCREYSYDEEIVFMI